MSPASIKRSVMTAFIKRARFSGFGLAICLAALLSGGSAFAKIIVVPKWGRFEQSFKSGIDYQYPLQQCTLRVTFTSPGGETNTVFGFWDGDKTWRVRFSPDQPGRWTYHTSCSDLANQRLNDQTGDFLCTAVIGDSRFAQHGPVRLTRDRRQFEHADGTPFFWMADVAWNAPRLSTPRDWITYTQTRAGEHFSAVQWAAAPGNDVENRPAFTGQSHIAIDPRYFRDLDGKIDMMNRAGLLSVIAPLWGDNGSAANLPEDQMKLLVRYMTARWGAYDVAWLLTVDDGRSERWLRIGRQIFGDTHHAPVILFPGALASSFGEFQNEDWVDAFGFGLGQNVNNDSLEWLVSGPLQHLWTNAPARPFINVLPPLENGFTAQGQDRITADDTRRIAWWSLLLTPPAGVSYGAQDVATWNTAKQSKMPTWQLSLFLPGARQMTNIVALFKTDDCQGLRPAPNAIVNQPGHDAPRRYIASARTESRDLIVTYVPEDREFELYVDALPPAPNIQWLNPRTGRKNAAVAVVGMRTCQLPTPDAGDWVLIVKSGK